MNFVHRVICAAATVAAITSQPAHASLIDVAMAGVVFGQDDLHIFGDDISLSGNRYVAHFRFDTDLGAGYQDASGGSVIGGISNDLPSPLVSSSITINDVTFAIGGEYWAGYDRHIALPAHWLRAYSESRTESSYTSMWFEANWDEGYFDGALTAPFSRVFVPSEFAVANFYAYSGGRASYAEFGRSHVYVREVSAVPEAAAWAMMISGFALVGAAMRTRRARRVAV